LGNGGWTVYRCDPRDITIGPDQQQNVLLR
jgi:hypothetical protein